MIDGLRELGKTVLLTTHYMDEAQALADRVAVIADGRIIAAGTPDDLGGRADAATLITFDAPAGAGASEIEGSVGGDWSRENGHALLRTAEPTKSLNELTTWAIANGVELHNLEVRRPSLEDVYLDLTGRESGQ